MEEGKGRSESGPNPRVNGTSFSINDPENQRAKKLWTVDNVKAMRFKSLAAAKSFYRLYAAATGFEVQKQGSFRGVGGQVIMRRWVCNRGGCCKKKKNLEKAKHSIRADCPAAFCVSLGYASRRWLVREFVAEHTHELGFKLFPQIYQPIEVEDYLTSLKDSSTSYRSYITIEDAEAAISYLTEKKDSEPRLFYEVNYVNASLARIFFADSMAHLYDSVVMKIRINEGKADYDSKYSKFAPSTSLVKMEKQAFDIFTRESYQRFLSEMQMEMHLVALEIDYDDPPCRKYKLAKIDHEDLAYEVMFNPCGLTIECSCLKFETFGFPCSHIFHVLKSEGFKDVPHNLMHQRWTKSAKSTAQFWRNYLPPVSVDVVAGMMSYGRVVCSSSPMLYLGTQSEEAFKIVSSCFVKLKGELDRQENSVLDVQDNKDTSSSSDWKIEQSGLSDYINYPYFEYVREVEVKCRDRLALVEAVKSCKCKEEEVKVKVKVAVETFKYMVEAAVTCKNTEDVVKVMEEVETCRHMVVVVMEMEVIYRYREVVVMGMVVEETCRNMEVVVKVMEEVETCKYMVEVVKVMVGVET
ncbi:hypothetical protein Ahy_B08g089188 [Arachis hypogaea]|uniref:Protein FAR1-RELATED SEQUENCE n=1 Tax=Arachis hypogaea TaxID=3818 RepID=A0A444XX18_ARAHY|nr:hypothetical protein Ahy_B08g089188 [Arachis hypogaea]